LKSCAKVSVFCLLCVSLARASHAAPDSDQAYKDLMKLRAECIGLSAMGKDDEALQVRRRILEEFPQFPAECTLTQYEIAHYYLKKRHQIEQAMVEYAALVEKYPKEEPAAEASWKLALHNLSFHKLDAVKRYLQNIVDNHPGFKARDRIGCLPTIEDKFEMWRILVSLLPQDSKERLSLQRDMGVSLQEAGMYEQAAREFTILAETCADPNYVAEGLWRQAFCNFNLMRYRDAKKALETIFAKYPTCFLKDEARKLYGQVLIYDSGPDKAIEYLQRIADDTAKTASLRAHALTAIGRIKGDKGDLAGAVQSFDLCSAQYPESAVMAMYYKCELLARKRKIEEAVKVQEELAKLYPVWGLIGLGHIESARNQHEEAYRRFREAAEKARGKKNKPAQIEALLGMYFEKLAVGGVRAAGKLKRELLRTAPRLARTRAIILSWELEQATRQPEGR